MTVPIKKGSNQQDRPPETINPITAGQSWSMIDILMLGWKNEVSCSKKNPKSSNPVNKPFSYS